MFSLPNPGLKITSTPLLCAAAKIRCMCSFSSQLLLSVVGLLGETTEHAQSSTLSHARSLAVLCVGGISIGVSSMGPCADSMQLFRINFSHITMQHSPTHNPPNISPLLSPVFFSPFSHYTVHSHSSFCYCENKSFSCLTSPCFWACQRG